MGCVYPSAMAQQTDDAHEPHHESSAVSGLTGLLANVSMYKDIGLDATGHSHFHAVEDDLVIVCEGDRRGRGVRDEDIVETHLITGEKTTEDWVAFVQDRRGWQDVRNDLEYRVFGRDGLPNSE